MVKIDIIQSTLRQMTNELHDKGIAIPGANLLLLESPNLETVELVPPEQQHYIAKSNNNAYWLTDIVEKHKNNPAYSVCAVFCLVKHITHAPIELCAPSTGTHAFASIGPRKTYITVG
jgi:hypothetical protein